MMKSSPIDDIPKVDLFNSTNSVYVDLIINNVKQINYNEWESIFIIQNSTERKVNLNNEWK